MISLIFRIFMSSEHRNDKPGPSWIPDGFIVFQMENERYVVPENLLPALQLSHDGYLKKKELEIEKATGTVSYFNYRK